MPDLRLIRAEVLKLRRRPGLVAATGVLAFASAVVYLAVLAVQIGRASCRERV